MMKETTRRRLRAASAVVCALSLAASMALPLVAVAQSAAPEEAAQLPMSDVPAATAGDATVSAEQQPAEEAITTESEGAGFVENDPWAFDASTADDDCLTASAHADESVDPDASDDVPSVVTLGESSQQIDEPPDSRDISEVRISLLVDTPAGCTSSSPPSTHVYFPSGLSFEEAKQQGVLSSSGENLFYCLGTDKVFAIGDPYPAFPEFTFQGWIDLGTGNRVTASTPLDALPDDASRVLATSWKKNGSNVSFYDSYASRLYANLYTKNAIEGTLTGSEVPAGASLMAAIGYTLKERDALYKEFGAEGAGVKREAFCVNDVRLFANGKQVHDGFGSMKIDFESSEFTDDVTVRIWHKHQDGSVTHQDVTPKNKIVSITVTDLSMFGVGVLGKKTDTPPTNDKPQQPGATQPPVEDQKPGGGTDDKKDEGGKKDDGTQKGTNDKQDKKGADKGLAKTGDDIRYALGGTMALLTCALFSGGIALLMGNRKEPIHRRC